MPTPYPDSSTDLDHLHDLKALIQQWSEEAGFQQMGITDVDLTDHERNLSQWLNNEYAGEMQYMSAHGTRRSRPAELIPGTERVICFRLDYLPPDLSDPRDLIASDSKAYIARYSLGRDYHKVIRGKLKKIWQKIETYLAEHQLAPAQGRVFTDSAPVLEKALAEKAGLGWIGKNTLLLNRDAGSWFFLGEIYTNLPLPLDAPNASHHCGTCRACLEVCPTKAFPAPYQLDARKCISYLTIEHKGVIAEEYREAMGNRIFGCDDCQIFCPWNKFANFSQETDFKPRNNFSEPELLELYTWSEAEFLQRTEGSAIRRTGYSGWLRNLSIALGNCAYSPAIVSALEQKALTANDLVKEHITWAINTQKKKQVSA